MANEEANGAFESTLKELHARRSGLQSELVELDQTISYLTKLARKDRPAEATPARPEPPVGNPIGPAARPWSYGPNPQPFATMSNRWAILHLLDSAPENLSTVEIAERLRANGKTTESTKFSNAVSAVLSNMKSPRAEIEVDPTDGKWSITEKGHNAIEHIRAKNRSAVWFVPINWGPLSSSKTETPDVSASGATN